MSTAHNATCVGDGDSLTFNPPRGCCSDGTSSVLAAVPGYEVSIRGGRRFGMTGTDPSLPEHRSGDRRRTRYSSTDVLIEFPQHYVCFVRDNCNMSLLYSPEESTNNVQSGTGFRVPIGDFWEAVPEATRG